MKTFDCTVCEKTGKLKEDRNCGWGKPGQCAKCGDIPFESVEMALDGSRFNCPICGGKVRWAKKAEFILGKYRTPGCPKSMISPRAMWYLNLVDWSESTGKLPTANTLLDESMFYFEVRNFVVNERNAASNEMQPEEKK